MILVRTSIVSTPDTTAVEWRGRIVYVEYFHPTGPELTAEVVIPGGATVAEDADEPTRSRLVGVFGNPSLSAMLRGSSAGRGVIGGGGLRVGVPVDTGSFDDNIAMRLAGALSLVDAGYDIDAYAGGYWPLTAFGSLQVIGDSMYGQLELAAITLFPVHERFDRDSTSVTLQSAVEFGVRAGADATYFHAGLRGQAVLSHQNIESYALTTPRAHRPDHGQIAVGLFAGLDVDFVFTRLGALIPVDVPLGFGLDAGRSYVVQLSAGRRY
jgi:hypothetical protein